MEHRGCGGRRAQTATPPGDLGAVRARYPSLTPLLPSGRTVGPASSPLPRALRWSRKQLWPWRQSRVQTTTRDVQPCLHGRFEGRTGNTIMRRVLGQTDAMVPNPVLLDAAAITGLIGQTYASGPRGRNCTRPCASGPRGDRSRCESSEQTAPPNGDAVGASPTTAPKGDAAGASAAGAPKGDAAGASAAGAPNGEAAGVSEAGAPNGEAEGASAASAPNGDAAGPAVPPNGDAPPNGDGAAVVGGLVPKGPSLSLSPKGAIRYEPNGGTRLEQTGERLSGCACIIKPECWRLPRAKVTLAKTHSACTPKPSSSCKLKTRMNQADAVTTRTIIYRTRAQVKRSPSLSADTNGHCTYGTSTFLSSLKSLKDISLLSC